MVVAVHAVLRAVAGAVDRRPDAAGAGPVVEALAAVSAACPDLDGGDLPGADLALPAADTALHEAATA